MGSATRSEAAASSINGVRLLKFLGAGGYANIYMARKTNGEMCAMKCVFKVLAATKKQTAQVTAEVTALTACKHHCVIGFHGVFFEEALVYICMVRPAPGVAFLYSVQSPDSPCHWSDHA